MSVYEAKIVILKEKMTTASVLSFYAFDQVLTLETDASISGRGAVVLQQQVYRKLYSEACEVDHCLQFNITIMSWSSELWLLCVH